MTTDTSEEGLETLIVRSLIDKAGYSVGDPNDYDRDPKELIVPVQPLRRPLRGDDHEVRTCTNPGRGRSA